ncbi:GNAT family N-acetyltransferase [Citrobacter freundii]|uniref:GNAT family N-acetyltransferase n=1 Tax=Citrobacter meridianamericanus TaxID=2894201 RepID=UPI00165004F9|nr:GNAT family N-acetyltransferase [Citrobacter freundii]MBC6506785.1 GNAT family N-acetyltransferase [Citrobacter freundii]
MSDIFNQFHQPIGMSLSDWRGAPFPEAQQITGRYCQLERINAARHAKGLYEAYCEASDFRDWTYLPVGPFETFDAFFVYLKKIEEQTDPMHFAVIDLASMKPVGTVALMRIDPSNGVIEVGHISYSPLMKRTRASTEVMSLVLKYVFEDLGYRRFEWKCDALNAPSREAAERFGFSFEGIFRQAIVTRGRNRDTAWYSIIDGEYPTLRPAYDMWLDEGNFDNQGRQIKRLAELMKRA